MTIGPAANSKVQFKTKIPDQCTDFDIVCKIRLMQQTLERQICNCCKNRNAHYLVTHLTQILALIRL